jgi:hypothetical protein
MWPHLPASLRHRPALHLKNVTNHKLIQTSEETQCSIFDLPKITPNQIEAALNFLEHLINTTKTTSAQFEV